VCFDDFKLKLTHCGQLIPGPDFVVAGPSDGVEPACSAGRPVLLMYSPFPGHYEALFPPSPLSQGHSGLLSSSSSAPLNEATNHKTLLSDVEAVCSSPEAPSPDAICALFFRLEFEGECLKQLSRKCGDARGEMYSTLVSEFRGRSTDLLKGIAVFHALLERLGRSFLQGLAEKPLLHEWAVFSEILPHLFEDEIFFDGLVRVAPGRGPLSRLYELVSSLSSAQAPSSPFAFYGYPFSM